MKNSYDDIFLMEDLEQETQVQENKAPKKSGGRFFLILLIILLLLSVLVLGGLLLYSKLKEDEDGERDVPALSENVEVLYTKEQVDELFARELESAVEKEIALRGDVLSDIKAYLAGGSSVVESFRRVYKDDIVIVSGGKYHFIPIRDDLKHNSFVPENLQILENGELQYLQDGQVITHKGIDVSKHQGDIDWQKVAADGVEFAILRVAYRGYGEAGKLNTDEKFEQNIKGALAAGIKVGVYLYSQAITREELLEEAQLVLDLIAPYKVECPVVFDVEKVSGDKGRMNEISVEERTEFTRLFCETIEKAGYKPMIYHNMEMGALLLNLDELEQYDKWFAYYNKDFYYPYEYRMWQYSDKGRINGINGDVDLNISFGPIWE